MSMIGRWAPIYRSLGGPFPYGAYSPTYQAAADWLVDCRTIEDFGAGTGWFGRFLRADQEYHPIDGTASAWVPHVEDLATYRPVTRPEGILCRHVLEHNVDWQAILDNLVASFTRRAVVVVFTPFGEQTHDLGDDESGLGVPTISFDPFDLFDRMAGTLVKVEEFNGPHCGHYGIETVFYLERRDL